MDLSNLSTDLPPTKPVNESSINDLNKDLTKEFKNAAKSVAALYRLSNTKNSILRYKGYLDCLDDLLQVISIGGDVENWALTKKAELNGGGSNNFNSTQPGVTQEKNGASQQQIIQQSIVENTEIPLDYDFTLSIPAPYQFHSGFPALSVNHANTQYQSHSNRRNIKELKDIKEKKDFKDKGKEREKEREKENVIVDEIEIDDQLSNNGLKRRLPENRTEKKSRTK